MTIDTPVTSSEFTYTQAKLILGNPAAYDKPRVRRAAVWMLGCLSASPEDLDEACDACAARHAAVIRSVLA